MCLRRLQPDTVPGDIVFVLQQKEHPKFQRKANDLFYEQNLSLTQALCGFQFVLTHLDGRQLLIKSNPGEVVKPGKRLINMSIFNFLVPSVQITTSNIDTSENYISGLCLTWCLVVVLGNGRFV